MLNSCQGKTKVLGLRQCFTFLEKRMWKDWCWSWNSSTLATWCKELTHWTRPWCWDRLKAGGEGDDRGWNGWMASLTQWTWVWENSGSWWWTGRPGVLQSMGVTKSWTQLSDWTELRQVPNGFVCETCLINVDQLTSYTRFYFLGVETWKWQLLIRLWLFCGLMDCSPPVSSDHGILWARILEWVAISFSRGSSWPGDRTNLLIGSWIL